VKTVAEAHGGSVDVRSEIGSGSVFELRLPVVSSPAPLHRGAQRLDRPEADRPEAEQAPSLSGP
jgi:hypothetical protein